MKGAGPFSFLPAGGRHGVELMGIDIHRDTFIPFRMGFVLP